LVREKSFRVILSRRHGEASLATCHSVKVKRLFFFFSDRHQHQWLKRLNKEVIDLGRGERMLFKGGSWTANIR
jgi:hypothetical protein